MTLTHYLGVDPDTKATGICLLTNVQPGRCRAEFLSAKAKGRTAIERAPGMAAALRSMLLTERVDYLAVEWMHLRPVEINPNAILAVQAAAGMALAVFAPLAGQTYLPIPSEWRGSLPKEEMHRRFLREAKSLGIEAEGQSSHEIDALGLCLWLRRGRVIRA